MAVGSLLLMADSGPEPEESLDERCPTVEALDSPFDYTTDCSSIPAQGHVALAWAAGYQHGPVDGAVQRLLEQGGIKVPSARVSWSDACNPVAFTIGGEEDPLRCAPVDIPIYQEQQVECVDIHGETRDDCTLIVRPAPPQ